VTVPAGPRARRQPWLSLAGAAWMRGQTPLSVKGGGAPKA
jgi:hypothetical protein